MVTILAPPTCYLTRVTIIRCAKSKKQKQKQSQRTQKPQQNRNKTTSLSFPKSYPTPLLIPQKSYTQTKLEALDTVVKDIETSVEKGVEIETEIFASLLETCYQLRSLPHGIRIHRLIPVTLLRRNVGLSSKLLRLYAAFGCVEDAHEVFDQMCKRDKFAFAWNSLISGYTELGQHEDALALYFQMEEDRVEPDRFTFPRALKACAGIGSIQIGMAVHRDIVRSGFWDDGFVLNALVDMYAKCGDIVKARRVFDKITSRDLISWNSMLTGYIRHGLLVEALDIFRGMLREGYQPDSVAVSTILSGVASSELGIEIHGWAIRRGIEWNLSIANSLIVLHSNRGELDRARWLFDQMPERDYVSWNTMISGYAQNGRMSQALQLFNSMPRRNVISWNAIMSGFLQNGDVVRAIDLFEKMPEHDEASLSALVSGLVRNGELDEAARILLEWGKWYDGREDLVHAYNTLLAGYGQRGRIEEARRLFDEIPSYHDEGKKYNKRFERNVVSWNSMIMCYLKANDVVSARQLFNQMTQRDSFSWNTMITGYIHMSDMDEAANLFRKMPNPDVLTWNLMITGFAQIGSLKVAHDFFERMPQKSLVSWNSIIAGYDKNEDYKGSITLFTKMQHEGERHDRHTLSSLLSASTGLVDLYLGRQVHQVVTKTVVADVPINNSLITMYSRCGAIKEARILFDDMKLHKDVISWNAMIGGYASHGFAAEALELFQLMKHLEVRPTHLTYIAVLNACSHTGLVEEGRRQFESMITEFGIEPRIEHYASLVDILGRHGQLGEAMDLINRMPLKPDKAVWGALLGGCRMHNNVELAQIAAQALMRIEPESSAPYVLLYNMYADAGQWDDAAKVRLAMEQNNVIKQRGYSRVCEI